MKQKAKYMVLGGLAAVVLMLIAGAVWVSLQHKGKVSQDIAQTESTNGDVRNAAAAGGSQNGEKQQETAVDNKGITALFKQMNTWESDSRKFIQYELVVSNAGAQDVKAWQMTFPVAADTKLEQCWNCQMVFHAEESGQVVALTPADYNNPIASGNETQGIGFVLSMANEQALEAYRIEVTMADSGTIVVDNASGQSSTAVENEENTHQSSGEADAAPNNGGNAGENNNSGDSGTSTDAGNREESGNGGAVQSPVVYGGLHVSGTALVDASGNPVQLRGVSTHGLAWFPQYVNYEAFRTLRDDWGANVVRLAMYTAEYGGYCSGGDQAALKQLIDDGVSYASQLGLYVIIDWHILSDSNPNSNKGAALAFFDEMSAKYCDYDNVIYEICNEPVNADWNSQIKPYAEEVIGTIRSHDADALILVGTNTWSQDVDAVVGNELSDGNVMYVQHFYAATHREQIRNKLTYALDNGVPVFVSECGICDASGNGGIDYGAAQEWLELLNSRGVSFIAWNLSNKNESSALIQSWCDKTSGWSQDELTESGIWFKNAIGG